MKLNSFAVKCTLTAWMLFAAVACWGKSYIMYVGTYTNNGSKGIYAYRYDAETGKLFSLGLAAKTENPSFLAADSGGEYLYAVNETENYGGASSGAVIAFAIDRATGKLKKLDEVPSRGADPCFISLDRSGKYVLVANYTGGDVAIFPVLVNGGIGEATSVMQD